MMPSFDILSIVGAAYRLIWAERFYLARLAAVPVVIIFLNYTVVSLIEMDVPPLRRGLFLLPAMAAEAWIVCQFVRTLLTRERWPVQLPAGFSGPLPPQLLDRARGLLSGMIFYLLIAIFFNVLAGVAKTVLPEDLSQPMPDPTPFTSGLMTFMWIMFVVMVVQFRLLWLYIPFVVNVSPKRYLAMTKHWMFNVQMLGLWLAASLPMIFVLIVVIQPFIPLTHGESFGAFAVYLILSFLNVVLQLCVSLVTSAAMAMALAPYMFGSKNGRR